MDGSAAFHSIRTTCPYCGVGCGVIARSDGPAVTVSGDPQHPANFGRLCAKGAALAETLSLDGRLLHPMIRGERVDWATALDAVADGLARTIREHGPDSVAFYVSGQLLTEDYYVANKLIKGFLGTANIDTNSRLCMASSVAGHRRAFGADVVPGNYLDLEQADLIVLAGSNLAWCHPVLFQRIVAARRQRPDLKLVVIDPRRTSTAEEADLHLQLRPGSDAVLFNGLLNHLSQFGKRNERFIHQHTTGLPPALAVVKGATLMAVAAACDLSSNAVEMFFKLFAARERTVTVYSQGVNQSSSGTDKVNAIINCHLLTGRIGRPGMGPFSVTGQPNAMGGREVGALANQLAAHMDFTPADRDRVARFWRAPAMARQPGRKAVDLFQAVGRGRIKAVWIMATNPVVSLPNATEVRTALRACPLVIVSDGSRASETARFATVRLPALLWSERNGTVTNSERRISRQRPFRAAPGEARADWWILSQVASRMGFGEHFAYASSADIFREHARLSAFENGGTRAFDIGALATLDDEAYDRLEPVHWPFRAGEAKPVERLFGDGVFVAPDRSANFVPVKPRLPHNHPDLAFPWLLNTGRLRDQWHTMTRTAIPRLMTHAAEPTISVHPEDGVGAGLIEGELAHLDSRWGDAILRVHFSTAQRRGEVFAPMHWSWPNAERSAVNRVVNPATDPISGQPELKHTPVRLTPFPALWHGVVLSREPLALNGFDYVAAIPGNGYWRYEIADRRTVTEVWEQLVQPFDAQGWSRAELRDAGAGRYRALWHDGKHNRICLFIGEPGDLPCRETVAGLFLKDERSVLAGGRGVAVVGEGSTICACHGVTEGRILAAAREGATTTEKIGAVTRAGTNCGSCLPELRRLIATKAMV